MPWLLFLVVLFLGICGGPGRCLGEQVKALKSAGCYQPICGMDTAFYIAAVQETDFFVQLPITEPTRFFTICLQIDTAREISGKAIHSDAANMNSSNDSTIFCAYTNSGRVGVPLQLDGVVPVTVSILRGGPDDQKLHYIAKKVYFVVSMANRPAVLSRLSTMSPPYATIMHGELDLSFIFDLEHQQINTRRFDTVVSGTNKSNVVPATPVHLMATGIEFDTRNVADTTVSTETTYIEVRNVEPASWFITGTPVYPTEIPDVDLINAMYNTDVKLLTTAEETSENLVRAYPFRSLIEHTLSPSQILANRKHSDVWKQYKREMEARSDSGKSTRSNTSSNDLIGKPTHDKNVCIWGSNKLDGQKSIWIHQVEHMSSIEDMRFTWVLTVDSNDDGNLGGNHEGLPPVDAFVRNGTVMSRLRELPLVAGKLAVELTPYYKMALTLEGLEERPNDGSPPCSELWDGDSKYIYKYASERFKVAGGDVDNITPLWARTMYVRMRDFLEKVDCSLIIYGNERGFSSDVLIRDTAKLLQVPTAAELLNLFMDDATKPDVIIAPSCYALTHESMQRATNGAGCGGLESDALKDDHQAYPSALVIAPSVDTVKFSRTSARPPISYHHAEGVFEDLGELPGSTIITIGFMARLAPEKQPATFLMAAHAMIEKQKMLVERFLIQQGRQDEGVETTMIVPKHVAMKALRFTIVGDGELRYHLEELARMLQIDRYVHFAGWVDALLPRVLAGIDIALNPSLRGWSETFCIANIEVMSMEIPLVTFGVGGVGEYVTAAEDINSHGSNGSLNKSSSSSADTFNAQSSYSISSNAVLINIATPAAVANAVGAVVYDPILRHRLGKAGRQTVEAYFTSDRQMKQYTDLYRDIASSWTYRKKKDKASS
jgi:glycosyltransferase involved in cell wall biosynthesis